jgi:hypothetical protein
MNLKEESLVQPERVSEPKFLKTSNKLALVTLTQSVALAGVVVLLFKLTY